MLFRCFIAAVAAMVATASLAQVAQLGGPANYPPAGFTGQQFVDNDGCVYLRAGFGGVVNWVPRVKANHRPLCDMPPTFGPAVAAAVAADMAPDPLAAPVMAAAPPLVAPPRQPLFGKPYPGDPIPLVPVAPRPQVAALVAPVAPPVAAPVLTAPAVAAQPAYATTANSAQAACVQGSPRLETVLLRSGGTALVCTRGDGTLNGWRPPLFAQGVIGGALTPRMMQGATLATTLYTSVQAANAIPTPPKGYRLAWKDDRLNPLRGLGTAAGQAQQDQVWTRDIPARLVAVPQVQASSTTVSTMSAPAARMSYVQVGTFGQPANADSVKARLTALGLPVSTARMTAQGRVLQVVYAGPFADLTQARAALNKTRSAGFADAILK